MKLLYVFTLLCPFFASLLANEVEDKDFYRPAVLLVPGAFHSATVYGQVVTLLRQAGYNHVDTFQLRSVGSLATRQEDIQPVVEALKKHIDAGRDVVLVGNSYGCTVIGEAVRGFPSYPLTSAAIPTDAVHSGRVRGLIYLNGYLPFIADVTNPSSHADIRKVSPNWFAFSPNDTSNGTPTTVRWDGDLYHFPPQKTFYNLLDPRSAEYWSTQLEFSSFAALNATASYVPYTGDFRVVYVAGKYDNSVSDALWSAYVNQPGAKFVLDELDVDHICMLSKPKEVTALIRKYAESIRPW